MAKPTRIYGVLAEFAHPDDLVVAIKAARSAGYRKLDAYTPMPVESVIEALEIHSTGLPPLVLLGGILGGLGGFFMQYYSFVISYPVNIGGRPLNNWPMFIPITFELTVLAAALTCVLGMLALNGLPRPYHPLFNVPSFALATKDHFFLCIQAIDPHFDREKTKQFVETLKPRQVIEVPE